MGTIIDPFQPLDRDGSVDLRRGQLAVAEKFLHAAQVGAVIEQMGRERVSQFVRSQFCIETCGGKVALQRQLHRPPIELSAVGGDEQRIDVEWTGSEIGVERANRRIPERAKAVPCALCP